MCDLLEFGENKQYGRSKDKRASARVREMAKEARQASSINQRRIRLLIRRRRGRVQKGNRSRDRRRIWTQRLRKRHIFPVGLDFF